MSHCRLPENTRGIAIQTNRLALRGWVKADLEPFAAMNADAAVMRYFPKCFNSSESTAQAEKLEAHGIAHGFTYWAAEELSTARFVGFIGLKVLLLPGRQPMLDIGWRLDKSVWRQGLASEGARACVSYAFDQVKAPELVAVASRQNQPSMGVMKKVGMTHLEDFSHPMIPDSSPLKVCSLFRICRSEYSG